MRRSIVLCFTYKEKHNIKSIDYAVRFLGLCWSLEWRLTVKQLATCGHPQETQTGAWTGNLSHSSCFIVGRKEVTTSLVEQLMPYWCRETGTLERALPCRGGAGKGSWLSFSTAEVIVSRTNWRTNFHLAFLHNWVDNVMCEPNVNEVHSIIIVAYQEGRILQYSKPSNYKKKDLVEDLSMRPIKTTFFEEDPCIFCNWEWYVTSASKIHNSSRPPTEKDPAPRGNALPF